MRLFKKKRKKKKPAARKRRNDEYLSQAEKKTLWIARWNSEIHNPPWKLDAFPDFLQKLIDDGSIPEGASIVDIGCGDGFLSASLAGKGFDVLGIDFAEPAIEQARNNYPEVNGKLRFIAADATKPMPFPDTFQVSIDRGTFHTIPMETRADYVKSISPMIEEGGCLVLLYAHSKAEKLSSSGNKDSGLDLKHHLSGLFEPSFKMEAFQESSFNRPGEDHIPGYLAILRKMRGEESF